MRYTYQIIVKSEHPEAIIANTVNRLEDNFTTVESIEEVNDETPPDEAIIKEIPFLYV
jgi:hypothetical protein|tara:strand:- start:1506 stop:1679 length:174 start_codon:yes stop_codon:yes gene_type:complete